MEKKQNQQIAKQERRKHPRIKDTLKVTLCSSQYLLDHDLLTKDISEGGICLLSPYYMELGKTVELGIYLPDQRKPLITTGKIMKRNETNDVKFPFILGIEFVDIDSESYKHICNYIRYYSPKT